MLYLITASFVWAFSFGLIKHKLVNPGLDASFTALVRLVLSFLVFAPFLRFKGLNLRTGLKLIGLGAIQYGLMYIAYMHSYRFLPSYLVALFTISTPIYVTLVNDLSERLFHRLFFLTSMLAVTGAAIILTTAGDARGAAIGFFLLQLSNIAFAFGQIWYRRLMSDCRLGITSGESAESSPVAGISSGDHGVFALMYLGGVLFASVFAAFMTPWAEISLSGSQVLSLVYLGVIPSGVCFFLWNVGARLTNPGTLAVLNNAKIPLAVGVSLVFFGETANVPRLLIGGAAIVAAVAVNERHKRRGE